MIKQLFITILVAGCCNAGFSQNDDKANVLAVEKSTANAFTKHNLTYLTSVFTDDIRVITPKGQLVSKQQLLQYVPQINSVVVSDMDVKIKGTVAIVTGVEIETGKDDSGNAYTNKVRFTDVLEKKNGQWVIIASQGTAME